MNYVSAGVGVDVVGAVAVAVAVVVGGGGGGGVVVGGGGALVVAIAPSVRPSCLPSLPSLGAPEDRSQT